MRTIAIINQKGGCGKTTVSINLAAALARQHRRTLLLDMDAQSHCALGLAVPEAHINRSTTDLMNAGLDGSINLIEVVWRIASNLDLAPSTMELSAVEQQLFSAMDRDTRLSQILATVEDRYDCCVIDCPPSLGLLTFNAFRAADEVIVPVETGFYAVHGSIRQQKTMDILAERVNHPARFSILPTMYDVRTRLARELLQQIQTNFGDAVLPTVIHFNSRLKEAASFGQPIMEYDPASRGMQDFEDLATWLLDNPPAKRQAQTDLYQQPVEPRPGLSRAEELVERAKGLAARAGSLSRRMSHETPVGTSELEAESRMAPTALSPQNEQAPRLKDSAISQQPSDPANMPEKIARLGPIVPRPPQPRADLTDFVPQVHIPLPEKRLAAMAKLFGVRRTNGGLLFVQPINATQSMAITGDFNDWNNNGVPMSCDKRLGVWQTTVDVPPGRYRYRLIVDGQPAPDPYNKQTDTDEGGRVSNIAEAA